MTKFISFFCLVFFYLTATPAKIAAQKVVTVMQADFNLPSGATFLVDDVKTATQLLRTDSALYVYELALMKKPLFIPEEHANLSLIHAYGNGFVQTLQECFDNHRPLVLSPDIVWMLICQGVSMHVNQNFDALGPILFSAERPKELSVRNDDLEKGSQAWASLVDGFAIETRKYTKDDINDFFVSQFSTTTTVEQTAFRITMMDAYRKAFDYVAETGCGIPNITLTGKASDWELILSKIEMLDKFQLSDWKESLRPVLQEFVNASRGKANQAFWKDIYKNADAYGERYLSGWMIKFFPYVKFHGEWLEHSEDEEEPSKVENKFVRNEFLRGNDYWKCNLTTENFPSGLSRVPLIWNNHFTGEHLNMELCSGFFGMRQYADMSLEPLVSWAVCNANAHRLEVDFPYYESEQQEHKEFFWIPGVFSKVSTKALYHPSKYTKETTIEPIRTHVLDALKYQTRWTENDYCNDTLMIEVLQNGSMGDVWLANHKNDATLNRFLYDVVDDMIGSWEPATKKLQEAWPDFEMTVSGLDESMTGDRLIRVNSIVDIPLRNQKP